MPLTGAADSAVLFRLEGGRNLVAGGDRNLVVRRICGLLELTLASRWIGKGRVDRIVVVCVPVIVEGLLCPECSDVRQVVKTRVRASGLIVHGGRRCSGRLFVVGIVDRGACVRKIKILDPIP
jgi:hypothetical protein